MKTQTEDLAAIVLASLVVAALTLGIDSFISSPKTDNAYKASSSNQVESKNNPLKEMDALLNLLAESGK